MTLALFIGTASDVRAVATPAFGVPDVSACVASSVSDRVRASVVAALASGDVHNSYLVTPSAGSMTDFDRFHAAF